MRCFTCCTAAGSSPRKFHSYELHQKFFFLPQGLPDFLPLSVIYCVPHSASLKHSIYPIYSTLRSNPCELMRVLLGVQLPDPSLAGPVRSSLHLHLSGMSAQLEQQIEQVGIAARIARYISQNSKEQQLEQTYMYMARTARYTVAAWQLHRLEQLAITVGTARYIEENSQVQQLDKLDTSARIARNSSQNRYIHRLEQLAITDRTTRYIGQNSQVQQLEQLVTSDRTARYSSQNRYIHRIEQLLQKHRVKQLGITARKTRYSPNVIEIM